MNFGTVMKCVYSKNISFTRKTKCKDAVGEKD